MAVIDERVVSLLFDGSGFDNAAEKSMGILTKLQGSLDSTSDYGADAFKSMTSSVVTVTEKLSLLEQVGIGALRELGTQLTRTGINFAKSLTIDQYMKGFTKYETSMKSVKTMMIQTGSTIEAVEEVMAKAMKYSDETSYDFSQIGNLMSTLVGAGVAIEDAEKLAEGISNIGAYAGKSANEMFIVYRNFGDVFTKGFLSANDYRSLNDYAHIFTPQLKQEILDQAEALGYLEKVSDGYYQTTKKVTAISGYAAGKSVTKNNLKDSLMYQWAQKDVMMAAIENFRWDETKDEDSLAYKAYMAAREYRTFTDVLETVKDVTSTAISTSFKSIFGNAEEAVELWTAVGDKMVEIFATPFVTLAEGLQSWKDGGGRWMLLEAGKLLWSSIEAIFGPIAEKFNESFGVDIPNMMYALTIGIINIANKLNPSESNINNITTFFEGVFKLSKAILTLMGKAGSALFKPILEFLGMRTDGYLSILASIGEGLSKIAEMLETSQKVATVLQTISGLIGGIMSGIGWVIDTIKTGVSSVVNSSLFSWMKGVISGFGEVLSGFGTWGDFLKNDVFGGKTLSNLMAGKTVIPIMLSIIGSIFAKKGIVALMAIMEGKAIEKVKENKITILDRVADITENYVTKWKRLKSTIETFLGNKKQLDVIDQLGNMLSKAIDNIVKVGKALLYIATALTMVGALVNNGTIYESMGALIVLLVAVLAFTKILKGMLTGATKLSAIAVAPFLSIATSLIFVAAALALLSVVNTGKLVVAGIVVGTILAVMAKIIKDFSTASYTLKSTESWKGKGLFAASGKSSLSRSGLGGMIGAVIGLAFAMDLMAIALVPVSMLPIGRMLVGALVLTAMIKILSNIVKNMTALIKYQSYTFGNMAAFTTQILGIVLLAAMMVPVGLTLAAMALFDWKRIVVGGAVLTIMMAVLVGLTKSLANLARGKDVFSVIGNIIFGIIAVLSLVAACVVLAAALMVLSTLNSVKLAIAAGVLVGTLASLVLIIGAIALFTKKKMDWAKIGNIALTILAIWTLIPAVVVLATALTVNQLGDVNRMRQNAITLVGTLAALGLIVGAVALFSKRGVMDWAKIGNMALVILAIVALAAVCAIIAVSLAAFIFIPYERALAGALSMVGVLAGISLVVGAIALFSNKTKVNGKQIANVALMILAIGALSVTMLTLAFALSLLKDLSPEQMKNGAIILSALMGVMAVLVYAFGKMRIKNGIKAVLAFLAIGAALKTVATSFIDAANAMKILSTIPVETISTAATVMVACLASILLVMGVIAGAIGKTDEWARISIVMAVATVAIMGMAKAAVTMAQAASMMQQVLNGSNGWQAIGAVVGIIFALIAAVWLLTKVLSSAAIEAPAILSLAGSLLTFGLACLTVSLSIALIAGSIGLLFGLIYLLGVAIIYLGEQGDGLLKTIEKGLEILSVLIGKGLYVIVYGAIMSVVAAIIDLMGPIGAAVFLIGYELIGSLIYGIVMGLLAGIGAVIEAVKILWGEAGAELTNETKGKKILEIFKDYFGFDGSALKELKGVMTSFGVTSGGAMTGGFMDGVSDTLSEATGIDITDLVAGVTDTAEAAGKTGGETLVDAGLEAAKNKLSDPTYSKELAGAIETMVVSSVDQAAMNEFGIDLAEARNGFKIAKGAMDGVKFTMGGWLLGLFNPKNWNAQENVYVDGEAIAAIAEGATTKAIEAVTGGVAEGALGAPAIKLPLGSIKIDTEEGEEASSFGNKIRMFLTNIVQNNLAGGVEEIGSAAVVSYENSLQPMTLATANTIDGCVSALLSSVDRFYAAGKANADAYSAGYRETLDIHSPSRKTYGYGVDTVQGSINGMLSKLPEIKAAADLIGTVVAGSFNQISMKTKDTKLVKSDDSGEGIVDSFITDLKTKAQSLLKDSGVDISGLTKFISYATGYDNEIDPETDSRFSEWTKKGYTIVAGDDGYYHAKRAGTPGGSFSGADEKLNIKVPDTTTLSLGSGTSGGSSSSTKAKTAMDGTYTFEDDPWAKFTYVQNNYSPKSLSRIEIYRQTNNQFNALKGGSYKRS